MNQTNYTLLSDWHIIWLRNEWEKATKEFNRRLIEDHDRFSHVLEEYWQYHHKGERVYGTFETD